jgi:hypothetical protein
LQDKNFPTKTEFPHQKETKMREKDNFNTKIIRFAAQKLHWCKLTVKIMSFSGTVCTEPDWTLLCESL